MTRPRPTAPPTTDRCRRGIPSTSDASRRQAAQLLALARNGVLDRIHRGEIPATTDGVSYLIAATDLDQRTDSVPADPIDQHPLALPSCTFEVLADLLAVSASATHSLAKHPGQGTGSDQRAPAARNRRFCATPSAS